MSNIKNSNKVTQTGNDVTDGDIVGRDKVVTQSGVVLNINTLSSLTAEALIELLLDHVRDEKFVRNFFEQRKTGNIKTQSLDQSLLLFETLKDYSPRDSISEIEREYGNIVLSNKMESTEEKIEYNIKFAAACLQKLDFNNAHQSLSNSLNLINPAHQRYEFIYKQFLITGFIWHSQRNDINGLRSLLRIKSKIGDKENPEVDYIVSMIFQEIFSRDIELESLREVVDSLEKIYDNASEVIKPAMANSLGLAYRRLGERTGISFLQKSVKKFQDGLQLNKNNDRKIEIELKDQKAAAHIRIFEFNHDKEQLSKAEELLNDCLILLEGPIEPRYYRLKPRILNNIGNIYKQKVLIFKEIRSASKAISYYEEAELYWNEKNAGYDWALLRKNIAETNYALGKITHDKKILLAALKDCLKSIKYRNLKNSPYQWGKTVNIILQVIILLNNLNDIKLVSRYHRIKTLSFTNEIINNAIKWNENISSEFVENAKKVQNIFN